MQTREHFVESQHAVVVEARHSAITSRESHMKSIMQTDNTALQAVASEGFGSDGPKLFHVSMNRRQLPCESGVVLSGISLFLDSLIFLLSSGSQAGQSCSDFLFELFGFPG